MRVVAGFCLCAALAGAEAPVPGTLRSVRSTRAADTLHLDFEFAGRPDRLRIGNRVGANGRPGLRIDLLGARIDTLSARKWPAWFVPARGVDTLGFQLELEKPAPWRSSWHGDVLRVDLLGDLRQPSFWASPLGIASAGAGLAAGGVALWVLATGSKGGSHGATDTGIPNPGFGFPK
jgi:hypothetical protein